MNSKLDKATLGLVAAYVLLLILVGWKVHVIETPGSAEMDGYADKADRIMSGEIPRDAYHPLLYPVLSAGAGKLTGNGFVGGRIVSSLFAGLLALMTYLLGRTCFGRGAAFIALLAVLINYNVITMGVEAATDMTFAALTATLLFLAVRVSSKMRLRDILGLGAAFGVMLFTRYNAFFLLPAVVAAIVFSFKGTSVCRRAVAASLCAAAALLVLLPHFVLTERVFGVPWYSESWRNLALKIHGGYDWSYFRGVRSGGLFSIIMGSPGRFALSFLREIAKFFHSTLIELGGSGLAGALFIVAAAAGFIGTWFAMDRKKLLLAIFAIGYVGFTCMFFYSGPRFMLPILPVGCLWASAAMLSRPFAGSFRLGKLRLARSLPVVALFMAALVMSSVAHLRMYVEAHPVQELEAARFIERTYGDEVTVLGTFPFLQRYVGYRYVELPDADAARLEHPEEYIDSLRANVIARRADFIMIGKLSLKNRPLALLSAEHPPAFLEPILRESDIVVYRVRKEALE